MILRILKTLKKLIAMFLKMRSEDSHDFLKLEYSKAKPLGEYQKEENLMSKQAS